MKKIICLIVFVTYIFLLFGQNENVGNLYVRIFDKKGEVSDKLKIELFSSSGETYNTNEKCFFNIPLNQSYTIYIHSKNYYVYHKIIYLSKKEQTDTVVLENMIYTTWFKLTSKNNTLTIKEKKAIKKYFDNCVLKSSNILLTINVGTFQQEDFKETIGYIFYLWTKYSIKNKNINQSSFNINFENNTSTEVTYYIEMEGGNAR